MKINAVFDDSILLKNIADRLKDLLDDLRVIVDGIEWDEQSDVLIRKLIFDFVMRGSDDDWVELDFTKNDIQYLAHGNKTFLIAEVFYPEQDLRYKNMQPAVLEIMKLIFAKIPPLLVAQDEEDGISKAITASATMRTGTSFLVIDRRLLPMDLEGDLIGDSNLFCVEALNENIIWINGPLGLGDETFHLSGRIDQPKRIDRSILSDAEFGEFQEKVGLHQSAIDKIVRAINFDKTLA
ncbi:MULTISPECIES: hypothetical protein [unclassified Deinococcus]|uniref:hypothetical protein n=1 Tax=unclassified Deinococcus TaxID=2623546 RepID=UPI001C2F81E4|nr:MULTISPECIES: hypothetical protein [unclassified Deinococcus]MDK2013556.1 hypothetical protein [Deinococcus sp. 43]